MKFQYLLFIATIGLFIGCKTAGPTINTLVSNFDRGQLSMINAGNAETPMRIYQLTNKKDSILLRQKSTPVTQPSQDQELEKFVSRLYATVRDSMSLGVGIAAPQVGILKNIIWVQRFDKDGFPFEVYLNPQIIQYTKKTQACMEGCLSIADKKGDSGKRAYAILIEYDKMDGSHHTEMIEDFTAVIFQHEIDHLDGILFIDHLDAETN